MAAQQGRETVAYSPVTKTIHRPANKGIKPACHERLPTSEFPDYRIAFRHAVDGDECGNPECFGGEEDG